MMDKISEIIEQVTAICKENHVELADAKGRDSEDKFVLSGTVQMFIMTGSWLEDTFGIS